MKKAQVLSMSAPVLLIIVIIGIAVFAIFSLATSKEGQSRLDELLDLGNESIEHGLNPTPIAEFSFSPDSGKAPLEVGFVDESRNDPVSWSWDFGDGETSVKQNPLHIYAQPGIYTVILTAGNEQGYLDDKIKENIIFVDVPEPIVDFAYAPASGTASLAVQFTDKSQYNPNYWEWDFNNDGVIDSDKQSPSYIYTKAGTYSVKLTAYNPSGSTSLTKTSIITVLPPPPQASFTVNTSSGQVPLPVKFTDTSTGSPASWCWDFYNDNAATVCDSTVQNPAFTYNYAGTWTAKLTASNSQGSTTATKSITVTAKSCYGDTQSTGYYQNCSTKVCESPASCNAPVTSCTAVGCSAADSAGKCTGTHEVKTYCWMIVDKDKCNNFGNCAWS